VQAMQRYYFHIRHGGRLLRDEKGIFLHGVNALDVVNSIQEILSESEVNPDCLKGNTVEIVNDRGQMVMTVAI
jgi:hypothetical protein